MIMKTKIALLSLISLVFLTSASFSQTFNKAKIDSLLDLLAAKDKAMGSLALYKDGKEIYTRAIGFSQIEPQKIIATPATKYRIGSISKMFTATLIFQLIEEGKLDLSATLDKFFPTLPNAEKISVANLLNHRSGIHNFTNDSSYLKWNTKPKTQSEMIAIIASYKPDFNPGSKTEYSNSNFVLLGYIVEKIRQAPYNEVLQKFICSKAGLESTYLGGKTDISKNECFSYVYKSQWEKQYETDMSIPHGAGAVVSTSSDLCKFMLALFSNQLVSEASRLSMMNITDGLGMGMMKFPFYEKEAYGHGGAIDAFNSMVGYFPEEKVAIAYCANGTIYSINDIMIGALSALFNKPFELPVFSSYQVTPAELEQYPGVYSSNQLPLKITITIKEGQLYAQATGQPSFPLECTEKNVFRFYTAGITINFNPDENKFILEQGGGKYHYTKDN